VFLGGWAFSYRRGTPVGPNRQKSERVSLPPQASTMRRCVQGYLAHKTTHPPRTLHSCLGSYGDPGRGGCFL